MSVLTGRTRTGSTQSRQRPATERATLALLVFLGVTATGGGVAFMVGPTSGPGAWFPEKWLDEIPLIDNFVVPGLVLGICFGLGSLVTAWGMLRRPRWAFLGWVERLTGLHWSWAATVLLGVGHIVWIGLELAYIDFSFFHPLYGAVGLALLTLPFTASMRRALAVR
jgi:hypothetical protein